MGLEGTRLGHVRANLVYAFSSASGLLKEHDTVAVGALGSIVDALDIGRLCKGH